MVRNENGQFVKGHPGNKNAPGRPPRAKEEKYLKSLFARVSLTDWRAIVDRAVQDAKRGDNVARKWLSDYILGTPIQRFEGDVQGNLRMIWDREIPTTSD